MGKTVSIFASGHRISYHRFRSISAGVSIKCFETLSVTSYQTKSHDCSLALYAFWISSVCPPNSHRYSDYISTCRVSERTSRIANPVPSFCLTCRRRMYSKVSLGAVRLYEKAVSRQYRACGGSSLELQASVSSDGRLIWFVGHVLN